MFVSGQTYFFHYMSINTYSGSGLSEKEPGFLGIDIGSVSLNTVLMDKDFNILENYYDYVHGKPFHVLYERLTSIIKKSSSGYFQWTYNDWFGREAWYPAGRRRFCQ